jgi:hypothetical protein
MVILREPRGCRKSSIANCDKYHSDQREQRYRILFIPTRADRERCFVVARAENNYIIEKTWRWLEGLYYESLGNSDSLYYEI